MSQTTISIKLVVFSIIENTLKIFLLHNALPSQGIEQGISLDEIVKRLFEKTTEITLKNQYREQLYTISSENNITIVYYVLIPETDNKNGELWTSFEKISNQIVDYAIISYAVQRLQWKIEYTNVVYSLLPEEFTLSDLQRTYEAILGKKLDKRNFRKKILLLHFLEPTDKKRINNTRPAQIYKFKSRMPTIINIFS